MQNVKITADSTCDLSGPLLQKYDISISPLSINMGDKTYHDGVDIHPDDLYGYAERTGRLPKTAAVTKQEYLRLFTPYVVAGRSVVHFTISSEMSSCYQNAVSAAAELENVYVVDSRNLSSAIGLLAIRASELAARGADGEEIKKRMDRDREKLETSFVISTLRYLSKGGRCSAVAALGANLLSLKPCIEVKGGRMTVGKKYRGKLEKCLERYGKDRLSGRKDLDLERCFITHSSLPPYVAARVRNLVRGYVPFQEILDTDAGCTVCSHCGPGTLGILFFRK